AVIGAGAMGAMYASHFADAGFRTLVVADPDRARGMRDNPIRVNGRVLDAEIVEPQKWDGGPVDLIIVAVKHHQLTEVAALARPLISPRTTLLSVLNGLDSEQILREALDVTADQIPLCIALAMDAERDGSDVRFRQSGRLVLGPADPAVQDALTRAGLTWETPADMRHQMWWKFMVNVGINQASAVLRAPYGRFAEPGPAHDLMWALIDEVRVVAAAEGVDLSDDDMHRWRTVLAAQPVDGMTSMHQDVLAGRPTEVDILGGHLLELARKHRITVPHNETVVWILRALEADLPEPARPLVDPFAVRKVADGVGTGDSTVDDVITAVTNVRVEPALQQVGAMLLEVLRGLAPEQTESLAPVIETLAASAWERDWEGDDLLAEDLLAALQGRETDPPLRPLRVNINDLVLAMTDSIGRGEHEGGYLNTVTGEAVHSMLTKSMYVDDPVDTDGPEWVWVEHTGSRTSWEDMADFVDTVEDADLRDRFERAIHGKGAFRRFRDVLHQDADEQTRARWFMEKEDRDWGRARAFLATHDLRPA
ncbi:MAG: ketopantoate reductase family protein, partial [Actinomycetia bacterium]|nr:ketopantoate reductase family protein [Actinomycetes bacterium]